MSSSKHSGGTPTPLRIGELAAATQVTPDTLRYYERLGLLVRPPRSLGGFRLYGHDAIGQVRFVKQAQVLGLELAEIRQLVSVDGAPGLAQCRQVQPLLRARLAELDDRLAELRVLRRTLSRALVDCEHKLADHPDAACPVVEELEQQSSDSGKSPSGSARGAVSRRRPRRSVRRWQPSPRAQRS